MYTRNYGVKLLSAFAVIIVFFGAFSAADCESQVNTGKNPQEITSFQQDVMAKLTGAGDVIKDVRLQNRFTQENRKAARDYLLQLFNGMGLKGLRHTYSDEGENIYAVLESTGSSDEYVVLGAHYDSVRDCPGANDNASGVVVVMTIAQSLGQLEKRSRNIIFVLFDQEERGMVGSRHFAQKLKDEGKNIHSVHTVDQMAWDKDGDRAIELEIPYDGAVALYEEAVRLRGNPVEIHVTPERGSDHSSFRRLEFPAVGLTEEYRNSDTTPHIHRSADTYETINFEYLLSSTLLIEEAMKLLVR